MFPFSPYSALKDSTELQIPTRDLLLNLILGEAVFFDLRLSSARQKTEQLPNFSLLSLFPKRGHSSHRTVQGLSNICKTCYSQSALNSFINTKSVEHGQISRDT